jgi:hypothetical protein
MDLQIKLPPANNARPRQAALDMWLSGKRNIRKDMIRYFCSIFYTRLPFFLLYIRTSKGDGKYGNGKMEEVF